MVILSNYGSLRIDVVFKPPSYMVKFISNSVLLSTFSGNWGIVKLSSRSCLFVSEIVSLSHVSRIYLITGDDVNIFESLLLDTSTILKFPLRQTLNEEDNLD